jgi:hypothetical protein
MKKLLSGVKQVHSSSRGSGSRSSDNGLQDSPWSSSFVPSLHGTVGLSRYLAHDDIPEATNGDGISICTTQEMEKYESLHRREFPHIHIYDVNLLERVVWTKSFPPFSRPSVGENSTMSLAKVRVS